MSEFSYDLAKFAENKSLGYLTAEHAGHDQGPGTSGTSRDLPTFTHEEIARVLTDEYWGRHSFQLNQAREITVSVTQLDDEGRLLARQALGAWAELTDITFIETARVDDSQIRFQDSDPGAGAGIAYDPRSGNLLESTVNISREWSEETEPRLDSYRYQTYLHEVGHALGLGHAGHYNISATFGEDNHYANDSWQASVMSYFSQSTNSNIDADYAFVMTPQAADILAIQDLYGAATDVRSGNTTYGHNSNAGGIWELFFNSDRSVTGTVYDTGGFDTIDLSQWQEDQLLNLDASDGSGGISSVAGGKGNLIIAEGTVIERAHGGSGNDTINGNEANNSLLGHAGSDRIEGRGGDDRMYGGATGDDTLSGGKGNDAGYGGSKKDLLVGGEQNDTLFGGADNDTIHGGYDDDELFGGSGSDLVFGEFGVNRIWGEGGADILRGGVDVDTIFGGNGGDKIRGGAGVDVVYGGTGSDTVVGGSDNDELFGGADNDTMHGGYGQDFLKGDGGDDLVFGEYGNDRIEGAAGNDVLRGGTHDDYIEGGDGHDNLYGDSNEDELFGGSGNDMLIGGGGSDTLTGGSGSDILTGNGGSDRFIFNKGNGHDTITDFQQNRDKIVVEGAVDNFGALAITQAGSDVLIRIANTHVTVEDDLVGNFSSSDFIF